MTEPIYAVYGARPVGVFSRTKGIVAFDYDDEWRRSPEGFSLSVCMPRTRAHHEGQHVLNFIDGLLPDNVTVRQGWGRLFHVDAANPLDLLRFVGEDVAGAIQYIPGASVSGSTEQSVTPLTEEQMAAFIRRGQEEAATWGVPGTAGRFSLAGQQSKMALSRRGDEWYLPTRRQPSTHILKPGVVNFEHSAECEFLTMRLAATMGLVTAGVELVEVDGFRAVAVTRFDRRVETTGEVSRVHQEDFCQALGVAPARRYESDGGPGAKALGDLVSGSLTARESIDAKRRLFDALAFNWLTLGTDAHAKNYSLQHRPGQVSFAPLYDLMSAAPYPAQISPRGRDTTLAQRVGGEGRFAWVRSRHWERTARDLGRNPQDAMDRLHHLAGSLPEAIDRVAVHNADLVGEFVDRWAQSLAGWVREAMSRIGE